jgi:2,4-dienoyl-CoA reductase (NADPH2)
VAAQRGHRVSLFDSATEIGGQFNLAKQIPGKEEFHETLRYFRQHIVDTGVRLRLGERVDADALSNFDEVVVATGVRPRMVEFPGSDHPKVISYLDVLQGHVEVGKKVAIIGAGGIGFDVAEFLVQEGESPSLDTKRWMSEWGVDANFHTEGGLVPPRPEPPARQVWLLQRTTGKPGAKLGKTTGWIHRSTLKAKGVKMLGSVEYLGVDDSGLLICVDGSAQTLPVDHIIICAGQEPRRDLFDALQARGQRAHLIGGADIAAELDAKRAIAHGSQLAAGL